jgi:8-oxo-dGTP pyrophosphatase MutT (NUDIX family)
MVHPRPASTVVLLRPDGNGGFDVLLTRRPAEMRFLGGFYVFPGGTVHRDDSSAKTLARCRGVTGGDARRILGDQHGGDEALGHWVAVIRELFEEVGILLCTTEDGGDPALADDSDKRRIEQKRQAIVKKQLEFGAFLESENLFCDLSRAVYFDHWVTPEIYSMRFDTRFYVAALPANQTPLQRSEEVTHSLWIKPMDAMARMDRRDFPILPPTTTVLSALSRIPTWERLSARFNLPLGSLP